MSYLDPCNGSAWCHWVISPCPDSSCIIISQPWKGLWQGQSHKSPAISSAVNKDFPVPFRIFRILSWNTGRETLFLKKLFRCQMPIYWKASAVGSPLQIGNPLLGFLARIFEDCEKAISIDRSRVLGQFWNMCWMAADVLGLGTGERRNRNEWKCGPFPWGIDNIIKRKYIISIFDPNQIQHKNSHYK